MNRTKIALAVLAAGFSWAAFAQSSAPAPQSPKAESAHCERHESAGCPMHKVEAGMKHEGHDMKQEAHGMKHEGQGMKHDRQGKKAGHCMGGMHGMHQG